MAKKLNLIEVIQKWMDTMAGQTFMNYAYSWGAAVVILGTLFKLTHIPGANLMLFIGMGTEVFVFIVAGFERVTERMPEHTTGTLSSETLEELAAVASTAVQNGGTTIIGGTGVAAGNGIIGDTGVAVGNGVIGGGTVVIGGGATEMAQIQATDPSTVEEAVKNYTEQLGELTEVLGRVKVQAERMSTDSEEMENLNRTLTGIATVYELQLRNISKQVATIEQIDEQTRHMAQQIEELNNVYARMIKALTVGSAIAPVTSQQEG
ncbi:MAG: gliding motility protein GldL [Bacteroidaceae bacterium]|nr:gliding motility protein GldL [Bacteroidaceae bacterium]